VGLNLAAGDLSASRWYVEKISALTIAAFGVYVICRALQSLLPGKGDSRLTPAHQHDASCGCGHHGVGHDLQGADWKTRLGVVLAIGARPCSGAIMILLFANALGIVSWGIAAVMTMALGTALDPRSVAGGALCPSPYGQTADTTTVRGPGWCRW
jgi:ABC-type nickel/cobalt efflux system permease component RcnA